MKVILEFDGLDPDDTAKLRRVMFADDMASALHGALEAFRQRRKYAEGQPTWDEAFTLLWDHVGEVVERLPE